MRWEQQVQFASQTDIGLRRKNNEDAVAARICTDEDEFRSRGHLFVVADGMGGHAVGELASKIAIETVPHLFFKLPEGDAPSLLVRAVTAANEAIHRRGSENRDFQRMGTTCSSLILTPRGLFVAHVGDSRIYRIRRDRIDQLTFDHSLVWELQRRNPRAAAQIDLAQHKNVITRSLGPEANVEVDLEGPYPVFPGDIYVLCTDGLSGQVSDEEIGAVVRELSPHQACRLLVHLANLRGGADNCTVQVVRIGELPANVTVTFEEPPPPDNGLSWTWLMAFWIAALLVVMGLSLLMFQHPLEGAFVTAIGGVGLIAMLWLVWRRETPPAPIPGGDASRTNYWRPYRTAVVKSSEALFADLTGMEVAIQRAAQEEQWSVDWDSHRQLVEAAAGSAAQGRYTKGVREIARAIDLLMTELPKAKREESPSRSGSG